MSREVLQTAGIQADSTPPYNQYPSGFDVLVTPSVTEFDNVTFSPNPAYERYLKMHKVLVGRSGAILLEQVSLDLHTEQMPRYLNVAGWAAVEASLIRTDYPTNTRLAFIDDALSSWMRALQNQRAWNETASDELAEFAFPLRAALDIANIPLFAGIIKGDVSKAILRRVYEDTLNIAQYNAVQANLAYKAGNVQALAEYVGFGYECNHLLAFNRGLSSSMFAVPSIARADTGYHHPRQTHDLLIVRQKWGHIDSLTPVEVKSSAGLNERKRYLALLVRGKMHLSVPGECRPEHTLEALAHVYEGKAKSKHYRVAKEVTRRIFTMSKDYNKGKKLGSVATSRSLVAFRDSSEVIANHPGLSKIPIRV